MPVRARARSSTCTIRQDNEHLPPHHFFGVPASSTASLLVRRHFFSLPSPMLGATLPRSCCCCPCLLRSGLWQRTHSSICRTYAGRLCQAVDWRGAVAAPLLLAPRHGPRDVGIAASTRSTQRPLPSRPAQLRLLYQYQVARSLAHARVRRPARRCCYSSSSRPFGMVLVGIAASSRSTR